MRCCNPKWHFRWLKETNHKKKWKKCHFGHQQLSLLLKLCAFLCDVRRPVDEVLNKAGNVWCQIAGEEYVDQCNSQEAVFLKSSCCFSKSSQAILRFCWFFAWKRTAKPKWSQDRNWSTERKSLRRILIWAMVFQVDNKKTVFLWKDAGHRNLVLQSWPCWICGGQTCAGGWQHYFDVRHELHCAGKVSGGVSLYFMAFVEALCLNSTWDVTPKNQHCS